MKCLNPITILCVIVFFLFFQFPQMARAGDYFATAQESAQITKTAPRVLTTPEVELPKEGMTRTTKTLLGVLVTAVIVGVAAIALGGGGGGGGGDDPLQTPTTGNVTVGW